MRTRISFSLLLTLALALSVSLVGCPCVRGPINASDSLRWWLFSNFGASKVCPEMLKRGMPIKVAALGAATVGRFFPAECHVTVDDTNHTMALTAAGTGYAFLPVTRRVGFYAGVAVEFRPDFRMEEDAVYVWGKFSRMLAPPDLRLQGVENPVVNLATQTPLGDLATVLGQGVLASELARGFTVVHQDDGDTFALGLLNPPDKPPRLFTPGSDHIALASDMSEVHAASREYIGPLSVESSGAALYIKLRVTGAPVQYVVVDKGAGDAWRQPYEHALPIGPAPAPPLAFGQAAGGDTNRTVPLGQGLYYVVVENLAPAPFSPLGVPLTLGEQISYVSYSIEVGDAP